jgi:hypothetical protein
MRSVSLAAAVVAVILGIAALGTSPQIAAANGNSAAAHACQKGGYLGLVGANGETFSNTGQCVSFAAHGGEFATEGIIVPAGMTVTLTNTVLSACNGLTYGYEINFGDDIDVGGKAPGCATEAEPDTTIGPFPTAVILRLYLVDNTCGDDPKYYSDGDHARVTPDVDGYTVDIADAGGSCEAIDSPRPPGINGNLHTEVVIS